MEEKSFLLFQSEGMDPAFSSSPTRTPARRPKPGASSKSGRTPGPSSGVLPIPEDSNDSPKRRARGRNRGSNVDGDKSLKKRLLAIYHAVYDCEVNYIF